MIQWNKLDASLQMCDNCNQIKNNMLKPTLFKFVSYCHNLIKVKHCFFWSIYSRIQSEYGKIRTRKNSVFGHFSHSESCTLLSSLRNIDHKLLDNTDYSMSKILLFGNSAFGTNDNAKVINLTIIYVLSTKRLDGPLL